jgi:hypothetical protein
MSEIKRVTLFGIKRRGLARWKAREWWCRQTVAIWSHEHTAWWRHNGMGYTDDPEQAWSVDFPTAYEHTKHCGPEKHIVFYAMTGSVTPANGPKHD